LQTVGQLKQHVGRGRSDFHPCVTLGHIVEQTASRNYSR
jgi:hypothetical protein